MNLPELAIRNRTLTVFTLFLLVAAGIGAFFKLGQLEDPDFTIKVAAVSTLLLAGSWGGTQYPWASPQIVGLAAAICQARVSSRHMG